MVDDLSEYFSQKQRIEALEKEVQRLKRSNTGWKYKYYKIREQLGYKKPLTRTDKALNMIRQIKQDGFNGTVVEQIRTVAKQTFLSVGHVQDLWYKH